MDGALCPYLSTLDAERNSAAPLDYPSFENRCTAIAGGGGALMLSDQSTFCLVAAHRACPRFQQAQAAGSRLPTDFDAPLPDAPELEPLDSDLLGGSHQQLQHALDDLADEPAVGRRAWGWIGAGVIFLTVVLCGSVAAAFAGWQAIRGDLFDGEQGRVATLAEQPAPTTELFIVVTATPSGPVTDTPTAGAVIYQEPTPTVFNFPVAVAPTPGPGQPIVVAGPDGSAPAAPGGIPIVTDPGAVQPPAAGQQAAPVAAPVAEPPVSEPAVELPLAEPIPPTRRPTPEFEIPTSTPAPELPTATPTATFGPPIIMFRSERANLDPGGCTLVSWNVKNVKEVYYEGQGVAGQGQKEECVDMEPEVLELLIVLPDGQPQVITTTLGVILPTETPTPTPTFTAVPVQTPTWTPIPPTATPTVSIIVGAQLDVSGGSRQSCAIGAECLINLVVTNIGNQVDGIGAQVVSQGPWPAQVCRTDGVCGADSISLYNMGPGNSGTIVMQLTVPAGVESQTVNYGVQAFSNNSGGAVRSDVISIDLEVN